MTSLIKTGEVGFDLCVKELMLKLGDGNTFEEVVAWPRLKSCDDDVNADAVFPVSP